MVKPLPADIAKRKSDLRNQAFAAKQAGRHAAAENLYVESWAILPEPKHGWDWSQEIARGNSVFFLERKDFAQAEHWAREVFKCEPLPNDPCPYILLGKIYLEWGKQDLAAENLVKAFEMGGRRGFVGEDPKYLKFAQAQMKK